MLNSSISLISDVLGNDAENAATVYGIYSFFEKIVNGLAVERVVNLYTTQEKSEELKYIVAQYGCYQWLRSCIYSVYGLF